MRILIVGGTGLIGSAIHARLSAEGHDCVLVSRHPGGKQGARHVALDVAVATDAARWTPVLAGVDAVINAAGALQGQDMRGVHVAGSAALYAACETAGVRRVILFSAIGANRDTPSDFSRTKQDGEAALMSRDLDWVVLRPSVVVGRPCAVRAIAPSVGYHAAGSSVMLRPARLPTASRDRTNPASPPAV